MLEKIEQIKKIKQNYYPIFFQQEYGINDVGIFLFKPIKIIKRALLFKIPFPTANFVQTRYKYGKMKRLKEVNEVWQHIR